jgi:hypothetical protein
VTCACGAVVKVAPHGLVPKQCRKCYQRDHDAMKNAARKSKQDAAANGKAPPLAAQPPPAGLTADAKAARLTKIRELARLNTECTMCGQKSAQLVAGVCPDCDGRADEDGRAP